MKEYIFPIKYFENDIFFPKNRIKHKDQVLVILLEALRLIMFQNPVKTYDGSQLILRISKMSRLFFFNEKKYYSINFPFTFHKTEDVIQISYRNMIEIDSKAISDIISILKDPRFKSDSPLDFIEPIIEMEDGYNSQFWFFIKELLMLEDGYVRFDNDLEEYEKAKREKREHFHPENHLDLFYTSANTFKIGLKKLISSSEFINYLDVETECDYLVSYHK